MRLILAASLVALPLAALAEDKPRNFTVEADAAYMKSTGSSEKETLKGRMEAQYTKSSWSHLLKLEGLNEVDNATNLRSAERYLVMEKTSWNFTERDYLFVKPQWEKDLHSGFEYQAFLAVGYGHIFVKSDTMFLSTDLGVGARRTKQDTGLGGATDEEAMGNGAIKFEWKFLPNARFNEDASLETSSSASVYRTRTAVTVSMTDMLGLNVAYETKRDTSAANSYDTLTTFGLNYRLK